MLFRKLSELITWIVLTVLFTLYIVPADTWYDTGNLSIPDFEQGTDPNLLYVGGAVRDFKGSYSVVVRDFNHGIVSEAGSAIFQYSKDAERPDPLPLSWWAPFSWVEISNLPSGLYTMEVCWTIHDPFEQWKLPSFNKVTCIESNIFRITKGGAKG